MARVLTVTLNPALDLTVQLPALRLGEVNRSDNLQAHAAGKGLNVAQVLADLGHQLTVTGFLGEANAQPFEQLFAARGFADRIRPRGGRDPQQHQAGRGRWADHRHQWPGLEVGAQRDELLARLERLVPGHELVVVAGSLPRGVEVPWFVELLQRLARLGARVALDTSGAALREGLALSPWLIKPNEEELAQARGLDPANAQALADEARRLNARIEHVVMSQGAAGSAGFRRQPPGMPSRRRCGWSAPWAPGIRCWPACSTACWRVGRPSAPWRMPRRLPLRPSAKSASASLIGRNWPSLKRPCGCSRSANNYKR